MTHPFLFEITNYFLSANSLAALLENLSVIAPSIEPPIPAVHNTSINYHTSSLMGLLAPLLTIFMPVLRVKTPNANKGPTFL